VELAVAPSGLIMLCDDPFDTTCEEDFDQLCPVGWHLCNIEEFNNNNDGWLQPWDSIQRGVGVISCRPGSGAGHMTFPSSGVMGDDSTNNCTYGSSRETCLTGYGCNQLDSQAVCCVDQPLCGNGVVDSPNEACDDGNPDNTDDCLDSCWWRRPSDYGYGC
jgi:cysteine-rich repeat protein